MQQWMIYTKRADFNALAEKYHISPVLARIIINRGVKEQEFESYLYGKIENISDAMLLPDMEKAAGIIIDAITSGKKIRIVGDYDVDGICSTYILLQGLKRLGANVSYDIPHRIHDGYGINNRIIDKAKADGVEFIITCDNGISAVDAVAHAKELGMTVVVTDHHEVPAIIPDADATVDPKRPDSVYSFKEICGGAVAFRLIEVLYKKSSIPYDELMSLSEFAAIATVADVMPLSGENRILVKEGLRHIRYTENIGLRKLIEVCALDINSISAYHVGFIIGPCLNACGRLEYAGTAVELLLSQNAEAAEKVALHLKQLNDDRKDMTEEFADKAIRLVDEEFSDDDVKVVYLPGCHEAIAGIIAGRIKEFYHHPAIVFTDSENDVLKGSARSIDAYNIFEKLTEAKEYLEKFGGHKLAAGLSIQRDKLDEFRMFLNSHSGLDKKDFIEQIWIDVALPFGVISEELIGQLNLLEPFGNGNEKPVFAQKDVEILSARVLGHQHNAIKMSLKDTNGSKADALRFGDADLFLSELAQKQQMDILYYPQVNEFQGRRNIQVVIKGWK